MTGGQVVIATALARPAFYHLRVPQTEASESHERYSRVRRHDRQPGAALISAAVTRAVLSPEALPGC